MSEGAQETKKIFCNRCSGGTNHLLRARYSRQRVVYEDGETHEPCGEVRASIWSCAGCEEETFEWQYLSTDDKEALPVYYPARSEEDFSIQPKPFSNLSQELSRLYNEVITSFNGECLLLCTIGLRTLIEGVCVDKGLKDMNLERQIDGLIKFLPSINIIEALHGFRFAGNDAAHRLEPLCRDHAAKAISIVEDLLSYLYDLDYKAIQMRDTSKRAAFRSAKLTSVQ